MPNILDEILAHKRREVEQARRARPLESLKSQPGYFLPRRNFYGAVSVPRRGGPNLIGELKRSSPWAGPLRPELDLVAMARECEAGGAQALGVLTDQKYFGGQLEDIARIKATVGLPVLREDFLLDPYQVHESRACGADAVLVSADGLEPPPAGELVALARSLELWVLLEVHTPARLFEVVRVMGDLLRNGVLLGINNRDLRAQRVDLATTEELGQLVPPGVPLVAEGGIRTRKDVERMHAAGARALLVGETLLQSDDPRRKIRELFG